VKKVVGCPVCHGAGGETEVILDDGSGPWEPCAFCNGKGEMIKGKQYYRALGFASGIARDKAKRGKMLLEADRGKK
jgi:hypothetical protein